MLARYPWLSAVAVIGMALAIAIGAAYFSIIGMALDSTLPVTDGDRIVTIQTRTVAGPAAGRNEGVLPQDFVQWRAELKSISELGAFHDETRNLITPAGRSDVVKVAAITATGFSLMHATPVLGRRLLGEDERPGAAPVVVIGYDQWRRQFDGDVRVIGASVRLDARVHTIVGVMPEGFMFPVRHHYWVPLRLTGTEMKLDEARLLVFGRNVRLHALPYTQTFIGTETPQVQLALRSFQLGAGILLLIVAVNVAILVYARTATRTGEIVVRTALGASRGRVVSQLFVEALVLTASAAALGLAIVAVAFGLIREWVQHAPHLDRVPYWYPARSLRVGSPLRRGVRGHRRGRRRRGAGAESDGTGRTSATAAVLAARLRHAAWPDLDRVDCRAGRDCRGDSPRRDAQRSRGARPGHACARRGGDRHASRHARDGSWIVP